MSSLGAYNPNAPFAKKSLVTSAIEIPLVYTIDNPPLPMLPPSLEIEIELQIN